MNAQPEADQIPYCLVMKTFIKYTGIYVGLSVLLGLVWVMLSYPDIPSTPGEWLWILILAIPLQLASEFISERVWNNKATRLVKQKTATRSLSIVRICYGVILLLTLIGFVLGAVYGWHMLRL